MRSVLLSNETLGLGHLRISLALAGALAARDEDSTALVVTGFAGYSRIRLPLRVDTLKLPSAPVSADSRWATTTVEQPSKLAIPSRLLLRLRGELALAALREFAPQVVVCDHEPLGRGGDLRLALEWLRKRRTSIVALGIRDFDDTDELLSYWTDELVETVCRLYDLAFVYNRAELDDVRVRALEAAGFPVHRTGLVGAPMAETGPPDLGEGYLLVMSGGGIDGYALLCGVIDALRAQPLSVPTLLLTGPMMPDADMAALREKATGLDVRMEEFRSDIDAVLSGARAVVSMAGYATVAEILGSGKPALLVPRDSPRSEQLLRARYWARLGRVQLIEPGALEPHALGNAIASLIEQQPSAGEPLTGATEAASILADVAAGL